MNTDVSAWVWSDYPHVAQPALLGVERFFREAHARFTRFEATSELSALNAAAGQPFRASPQMFEVVDLARKFSTLTGGLFNPTILGALEAAGYDRTFAAIGREPDGDPRSAAAGSAIRAAATIRLDAAQRTITLPIDVRIDLGGIAKGWAAQQATQQLAQAGPCLVDAGGDMRTIGVAPGTTHWLIEVVDPFDRARDVLTLRLRDQAVATSGIDRRKWPRRAGGWQHHLIDPRTGRSADSDVLTATVIAPTTVEAEVYAKMVFLLGSEAGLQFVDEHPTLAACVVLTSGAVRISASLLRAAQLDRHLTYAAGPVR